MATLSSGVINPNLLSTTTFTSPLLLEPLDFIKVNDNFTNILKLNGVSVKMDSLAVSALTKLKNKYKNTSVTVLTGSSETIQSGGAGGASTGGSGK